MSMKSKCQYKVHKVYMRNSVNTSKHSVFRMSPDTTSHLPCWDTLGITTNPFFFVICFTIKARQGDVLKYCDKTTRLNGQKKTHNITNLTITDIDWYTGVGINVMKNSATLWYLSEDMLLNIFITRTRQYMASLRFLWCTHQYHWKRKIKPCRT